MPTDTIFSLSLNLYSKKARIKSITPVSTYMISSVLMNFSPRPSGLIVGFPPDAFSLLLYKSLLCTLPTLLFLFSDYQFLLALFYIYADLSTFMSILYFLVSAILKKSGTDNSAPLSSANIGFILRQRTFSNLNFINVPLNRSELLSVHTLRSDR